MLATRNYLLLPRFLSGYTEQTRSESLLLGGIAKVGKNEAERVKNVAGKRGTAMHHSYLEKYMVAEKNLLDLTEEGVEAKRMAEVVIETKDLPDLEEIWGSEVRSITTQGCMQVQTDLVWDLSGTRKYS